MKTLGNIIWFIFGGLILAAGWLIAGVLCCITIIGIPVGLQCFKFSSLMLFPFGKEVVYSSSIGNFLVNILWIIFFGWELAIASIAVGIFMCITVVGIPFGLQSFKFAFLSLMPFGAKIVESK